MTRCRVCMRVNNVFTSDLRVRREAETLAQAGYDVTVVADWRPGRDLARTESVEGVRIVRVANTSRIPFASLVRPLVAESADVYHAHDVDSLLPCWLAARRVPGAQVVYDSHELWSAHARDKVHAKRRVLVALEGPLLRRSAALIAASPAYLEEIVSLHRFAGPTQTVLNAPAFRSDEELAPRWAARDAASETVTITAVSVFQEGRGAVPLIRALEHLPERFIVDLVGPIPQAHYEARIREEAAPFGSRVRLSGAIPPDEIVPRLASSDLSAVLIEPISRSYELTSPNKLYDSLMAGTPIVASSYGVIGSVVRQTAAGVTCDVADPADIARATLEAHEHRVELRANARLAAERYCWEVESEGLLSLYERVVGPAPC